jgi:hypothetical protein
MLGRNGKVYAWRKPNERLDMTWRVVLLENPRSVRKVPDNNRPKIIV